MIQASIYGRLGGDPIERQTRNGNSMTTVSIAVNAARHGADEETVWFSVAAFGRTGETLLRHAKGDLVAAMGTLHRTRFTGRDGVEREGWSLTAETVISGRTVRPGGGSKAKNDSRREAEQQSGPPSDRTSGEEPRPHRVGPTEEYGQPGADFDDEIPF